MFTGIKRSILVSLWFMFLTFPLMVIRVNTVQEVIEWRWMNMALIGAAAFFGSFLWRYLMAQKAKGGKALEEGAEPPVPWNQRLMEDRKYFIPFISIVGVAAIGFPFVFSDYQINIMISALIFVVLGLGLNIVVGLAGLLDLGYVAFYAVGAYAYALMNIHFGLGFWLAIPVCMGIAALTGILLGIPVLRLRGDYLAIVTLGFGEIIRLILENWSDFTYGPSGIKNIPLPTAFGIEITRSQAYTFTYFLMIAMVLFTIFVVNRLQDSRLGRSWIALREDEIACQAMGIDRMKTKLIAFSLGATWAGMVGVIFAAKTTYINPLSFTFLESAIILSIVVLGGMGSILGVIIAAFILILTPEYLRAFSEYRMLLFGASMVLMMVFRPQGLISNVRRKYEFHKEDLAEVEANNG